MNQKKIIETLHIKTNIAESSDKPQTFSYLRELASLFEDGPFWIEGVKQELLNPTSEGITGNMLSLAIDHDKVIITSLFTDPDEYSIEIDRNMLLYVINQWQNIHQQQCKTIIFTHYDDGTISVTGKDCS